MQLRQGVRLAARARKAERHDGGAVQYAWLVGFELRYPMGLKSAGIYAIISRHLAETAQQRRFAFELLLVEYAAAARLYARTAVCAVLFNMPGNSDSNQRCTRKNNAT
jgi:hypothetical protein